MIGNILKITPPLITQPGVLARIISETPKTVEVVFIDIFCPAHEVRWGREQIKGEREDFLRRLFVGQVHKFWKADPELHRPGMEVGGARVIENWNILDI